MNKFRVSSKAMREVAVCWLLAMGVLAALLFVPSHAPNETLRLSALAPAAGQISADPSREQSLAARLDPDADCASCPAQEYADEPC